MSVIEKSVAAKCLLVQVFMDLSDCVIRDYHEWLPFDFDIYNARQERVACANYYAGMCDENNACAEWHLNFLNGTSFAVSLHPGGDWLISSPLGELPFTRENLFRIVNESGALLPNVIVHPAIAKWRHNCRNAGVDSRLYRVP